MNFNSDQLPLVQSDEFLPSISPWATLGGGALVAVFGTTVVLASVLNYNVTVKAPANIRPAGDLRLVQAATGGTVRSITAEGNQVVQAGQAIAYIDDSQLQTQRSQLQASLQQGQLQLGQIDAQLSNLNTQVLAESNMISRTIAAAQAELAGNQRYYQDQQIATQANAAEAEVNLYIARMQQERLQQGKEIKAALREAETGLKLAKAQRDRLKPVVDAGAISRNYFEEKQLAVQIAEAKLEQTRDNAYDQFDEKKLAVSVAAAKLKRAQTALNPTDAAVQVAAKRIEQEQAKGAATLAILNKERETMIQRRIELQNQLYQAQKALQQVQTDLSQSVIRAPIEGVLLQLDLRNPGQVVQPGTAIAQIAPMNAPLVIKTYVAAQDIDKVKPAQKVQMQVSACPYPDYGTLKGAVKTVAPDALPPTTKGMGGSASPASYEVIIQPQTMFVGKGEDQCRLQAGMEGRADIISREETVLTFVLRKARLLTNL